MPLTVTHSDELSLRQLEGVAHMALDTGEGLAATATASLGADGYRVSLAFADGEGSRRDYWIGQVKDDFFIARWSRLLDVNVHVAVSA